MVNNEIAFLSVLKLGIRAIGSGLIPKGTNWHVVKALADRHGLSAIVIDGIEHLSNRQRPPQELMLEWIGEVLQNYEYRYEQYCKAISELAGFYNLHGLKMMVLKGYACSLDWSKPEHRPCGDIDIWQFGNQKEADKLILKEKNIEVDSSYHQHTVFIWHDFMVENHYNFLNVYHHRSNRKLEDILKELGKDDSYFVNVRGEKVYLPSPNLNALFLLRHSMNDFCAFSVNLRQLIDWGFFVEKHTTEINWKWLLNVLEKYQMMDFFNIINAICVDDLGFDSSAFPNIQFNTALKDKVLLDILEPKYSREEPNDFFMKCIYKYKRWKGNAWKQKLCYPESRWEYFWSGIWAKMLKPASF